MAEQLRFSPSDPAPSRQSAEPAASPATDTRPPLGGFAPVWLQRLSLFVLVLFCVYLGALVIVLPWWPRIWDHNAFIQARPVLAHVLQHGAIRGMISGLGILDIWIGLSEAIHYRDFRP